MEKTALETGFETKFYDDVVNRPEIIRIIPQQLYDKFVRYALENERYEDMKKLEDVKGKVSDKPITELMSEALSELQKNLMASRPEFSLRFILATFCQDIDEDLLQDESGEDKKTTFTVDEVRKCLMKNLIVTGHSLKMMGVDFDKSLL